MLLSLSAIAAVMAVSVVNAGETTWKRIEAPEYFVDDHGVERYPSCSGGPDMVETPLGDVPKIADKKYAFLVRPGVPSKLAIVWDGGGACWDFNTCIGTALADAPIYSLTVDETVDDLNMARGLGDLSNPENPIADYTLVVIPYCTGDLHFGDSITEYALGPVTWTIHHRGADNVAAVLAWLKDYYDGRRPPVDVFLAGGSAGGYGVLYHYPAVAAWLPWYSRVAVLVDAANGVINQDFYNRALTPSGVWRVWDNLSPVLANAFASGPDELIIELFKSLGANYPGARFGQYTTAYDATQIGYFNIARNLNSPDLWLNPGELAAAAFEWTIRARTYMILTAFQTWNYRHYVGKGTDHTIVVSDKFYLEDTARGVAFVNWLDDMINRFWLWGSAWRNVRCTPECL